MSRALRVLATLAFVSQLWPEGSGSNLAPSYSSASIVNSASNQAPLSANAIATVYGTNMAYDVASVCILPYALRRCADLLRGSTVKASTTIGFPHGGHTTAVKVAEAERALADGGDELDMVVNISQVLSENWHYVQQLLKNGKK